MIASAVVIPTVGWLGNVLGNRNPLPGLIGLLLVLAILPQTREKLRRRLGTPGLIALASFLVSLLLALSLGRRYGWNSSFIQRCLVIGESGPEAL